MRKLLWGFAVVLTASIIILACQKEASSPRDANKKFDGKAAKEWYYGTFKRSAEWQSSNQKGKKLPDWKHPTIYKIGNNEVVEFPLVEGKTSYPISPKHGNNALTTDQLIRIADAAISRIAFIKAPNGQILVREINYIPDWSYLLRKNYDISSVNILNPGNDFSGNLIIKKWDGTVVSSSIAFEGKIVRKGKLKTDKSNTINNKGAGSNKVEELECEDIELCIWQMDCTIEFSADQMTTTCGEWYNTGNCWLEPFCNWVGTPCEMYGIDCEDPEPEPDPEECDMTESEAEDLLQSVTSEILTNGTASSGGEIGPDPDGIIRKPVTVQLHSITYNYWGGYNSEYTLTFTGVIFKHINNATWKWEAIQYHGIPKTSGSAPLCLTTVVTAAVAGPIISTDKTQASFTSAVTANLEVTCLFGMKVRSMNDNINGIYLAGDPVTIY